MLDPLDRFSRDSSLFQFTNKRLRAGRLGAAAVPDSGLRKEGKGANLNSKKQQVQGRTLHRLR